MQRLTTTMVIAAALVLAACQDPARSVSTGSPDSSLGPTTNHVTDRYIVVFRDQVADPDGTAHTLVTALGGSLLHTYTAAIKGFAARLPAPAVAALRNNPLVGSIEADQVYSIDVTQNMDANGDPWGLDRIDQGALPLSRTYGYTSTGAGVHAYIIDTGIWTLHGEFGGRATNVFDAYGAT